MNSINGCLTMTDFELRELMKREAYEEGYAEYKKDGGRDDNPYNNDDEWDLNQMWMEGFHAAGWDD